MSTENFQRRSVEEGRQVQGLAQKVLVGCGFTNLRPNAKHASLGVTVNFTGTDALGQDWFFDVSGAFTIDRYRAFAIQRNSTALCLITPLVRMSKFASHSSRSPRRCQREPASTSSSCRID